MSETNDEVKRLLAEGAKALPPEVAELERLMCGCGNQTAAWEWIHTTLRLFAAHNFAGDLSGVEYFALYVLDHHEMIDHGSLITCSFLTAKGVEVLKFLDENTSAFREKADWIDVSTGCFYLQQG